MRNDCVFYYKRIAAKLKDRDDGSDADYCEAKATACFERADRYKCWTEMRKRLIQEGWALLRRTVCLDRGCSSFGRATPLGWTQLQAFYRTRLKRMTRESLKEKEAQQMLVTTRAKHKSAVGYDERLATQDELRKATIAYLKIVGFSYRECGG